MTKRGHLLWFFKTVIIFALTSESDRNRPFHGLWRHLGWGANTAKITVNVWDFGPLGTAITPLQRGGFPTFATTLNSFIDIIHSTEKEGTTSVNSNYKSSHVASNFMVICIMLTRRISILKIRLRSLKPELLLYTSLKYSQYKSHTFTVIFPCLPPSQDGIINREKVYYVYISLYVYAQVTQAHCLCHVRVS